jgi:hypothetical protein
VRIAKAALAIRDLTLEDAFDRSHQFLRNRVGCSLVLDANGWCRSRVSAWAGPRPSSPDQKGTGDCACAKEETHHDYGPSFHWLLDPADRQVLGKQAAQMADEALVRLLEQ